MPFDPTVDHYQPIRKVIQRVLQESEFPTGDVERVEITCLANGECTYRVWPARAEEPVQGTYMNPDAPREVPA